MTHIIALDWGTTSLRAWRLDREGNITETRNRGRGITAVPDGRFNEELHRLVGDWMTAYPEARLIACGMIGSKNGWREVPYAPCPAHAETLAAGITSLEVTGGRELLLVPGVRFESQARTDVMRGEETQILGALADNASGLVVLPGTHAKWAHVKNGSVTDFSTYLTGELFSAVKTATLIGTMVGAPVSEALFSRAVREALTDGAGLLNPLFALRADVLNGRYPESEVADRLSGLLIGTELKEAFQRYGTPSALTLVGGDSLCRLYELAFETAGIPVTRCGEEAAARGLYRLATLRERSRS